MDESNKSDTSASANESTTSKSGGPSPYLLPVAIVIAGLVIGGAVVFSSGSGKSLFTKKASSKFQACLTSDRHNAKIEADTQDGITAGGTGTPYVVVLNTDGEAFPFSGALPYEEVKATVDEALAAIDGKNDAGATSTAKNVRPVGKDDHVFGSADAPVTLVEYSDFECPFCDHIHPTLKQIVTDYQGKVRWVYRDFPLTTIHPDAQGAAVAAECATELGGNDAFWKMADLLFQNQQRLGQALYLENAAVLKI